MILTVTANPMLDKAIRVSRVQLGKTVRAHSVDAKAGGKGINVARQLTRLGTPSMATGFLGGPTGIQLQARMDRDGIAHDFVEVKSITREGFSFVDDDGTVTAVFEPSGTIEASEVDFLLQKVSSTLSKGDWLVMAGSVPCPSLDGLYSTLIHTARQKGAHTFLDTYGEPLRQTLQAKPDLLKLNDQEYAACFGISLSGEEAFRTAVGNLSKELGGRVILTSGSGPFFASNSNCVWKGTPPTVITKDAVGSGDSMSAGILHGLLEYGTFEEALRWGAAAGAANAEDWDTSNAPKTRVEELARSVVLESLG